MLLFNVIYFTCVVIIFSFQYINNDNWHTNIHNVDKTRYSLNIYFKRLLLENNETAQLEENSDEYSSTQLDDNQSTISVEECEKSLKEFFDDCKRENYPGKVFHLCDYVDDIEEIKRGGSKTNLLLEEYGDAVIYDKEELLIISELLNTYLEDERHLCMIKKILDYTKIYRNPLLYARYKIKKFFKKYIKKTK
ncbi:putative exported protein [Plasmodium gaboni]|uniref:Putative exported protein n=1 Tax=Plasmodium gaboni TaxID=647221 RepID=A0A151LNS3_9APIC|nr:putative exported protein [Plasmodium gaboni]KYO00883.1 putative exported protein [Plasmodium gaboni]